MSIFGVQLEWDTMAIQNKMMEFLNERSFKIDTVFGMSDEGTTALILECDKEHTHISIEIGNESKDIRIRGGLTGKYLAKGYGLPRLKETFSSNQLTQASEFFVKTVNWCSDHADEDHSCL